MMLVWSKLFTIAYETLHGLYIGPYLRQPTRYIPPRHHPGYLYLNVAQGHRLKVMASNGKAVCLMAGPQPTHVDACYGNALRWNSCDYEDQTCMQRARTNVMNVESVKLADGYDRSLKPRVAPCRQLVTCSKQFATEDHHSSRQTDDPSAHEHERAERPPQEQGRRSDCGEHGQMVGDRKVSKI